MSSVTSFMSYLRPEKAIITGDLTRCECKNSNVALTYFDALSLHRKKEEKKKGIEMMRNETKAERVTRKKVRFPTQHRKKCI